MQAFVGWLINDLPIKANTFAYSHFGGRFDMVITFRELFRRGYNPEMIRRGNKMYEMKLRAQKNKHPNIVFRDSFNLMPCALGQLVPPTVWTSRRKPFFPHMVNPPGQLWPRNFSDPRRLPRPRHDAEKRRQFDKLVRTTSNTSGQIIFLLIIWPSYRKEANDNAQNQSLLALRFFKWYAEKHGVAAAGLPTRQAERRGWATILLTLGSKRRRGPLKLCVARVQQVLPG
ncbi:hypothetical protein niasHT_010610 [Heterodera trifolii]|uniref:Uncharacterized protein n=1 Tax=Heterodera trifolii TaxID=157864 RepID=A0ABD2L8U9_9BILA